MSDRVAISTDQAPAAIGTYSQAIKMGGLLFISGQIPLRPDGEMVSNDFTAEVTQILDNLAAIAARAGTELDRAAKFTVFLTDLNDFAAVNEIMAARLSEPYAARAAIGVAALPKGARVEIDAILGLGE